MTAPGVMLITGAASGIGLAAAELFARRGARLYLTGRSLDRLRAAAGHLNATLLSCDVTNPEQIAQTVGRIEREAGALDLLVNSAGQLEVGPGDQLGSAVAERLAAVNYLGAVRMIEAALPLLRRADRPAIINVSSIAGRLAPPYMAAYAASKSALTAYSHALRQELGREGIHVGLIMPGPVQTPMVQGRLGGAYYPMPPGVRILQAAQVAAAIERAAVRRQSEVFLPGALRVVAPLASAFPRLVDMLYAFLGRVGAQALRSAQISRREGS